jgi:hypothetical protein
MLCNRYQDKSNEGESQKPMSNQHNFFFGALAGALIIAIVAVVTSVVLTSTAGGETDISNTRQITVMGEGEARGKPDTARVEIGVETTAPTTNEALSQNNVQVTTIISRLQELGIASADIQTSNFNIYPNYDEQGQDVTSYTVNNNVTVTIRNLDQAGSLLDEVVQVGANRIYGMMFSVDDPSALIAQARDAALQDARARAERLAQSSGLSVGEVLIITENTGSMPAGAMPMGRGSAAEQAQSAVPVQVGEQTFTARIQVTYELQP